MPVFSTAASIRSRSASFSAPAPRICSATSSYYRTWNTRGIERARPSDVWNHFSSTSVDVIAERFGFEGPAVLYVVAACSSSTMAIGQGAEAIRRGRADAVLAGGADALAG